MDIDYQIIRQNRRSISLQIDKSGQLIVKAPILMPKFIINKFVKDKSEWIIKHQQKITTQLAHANVAKQNQTYLFLGQDYELSIGKHSQIHIDDKLYFPEFLKFRLSKELTNWYITQAKKVISERVAYHAKLMQVNHSHITFSDTISKWGSCTHDNRLQFNWRLIMSPLVVIDYVVVHELAHTKEKNHGANFWKIVTNYKPAHKQHIKWLKNNAQILQIMIKSA